MNRAIARALRGAVACALVAWSVAAAAAPVDANTATQAQLEAVGGVGPSLAEKILAQRRARPFADWQDLIDRVDGIGRGNAAKLSSEGLTVGGVPYRGGPSPAQQRGASAAPAAAAGAAPPAGTTPAK